jgi:hypothetical protein
VAMVLGSNVIFNHSFEKNIKRAIGNRYYTVKVHLRGLNMVI